MTEQEVKRITLDNSWLLENTFRMRLTLLFILTLLSMITSTMAGPAKFERWFPLFSARTYTNTSTNTCSETLLQYREARRTGSPSWVADTCSFHQQCILANLREDIIARMASASVLLGLTPGLLASLGPMVAEISLLSTERPILSLLLSFGSPAVFPSRVLKYQSALEILDERSYGPSFPAFLNSRALQILVSVAQYLVSLSAVINVIHTSWQLGDRTTVTFWCVSYYFPLLWTSLPIVVHLPSALAFVPFASWRKAFTRWRHGIDDDRNLLRKEFDLCMTRKQSKRHTVAPTRWAVSLNYIATILGFLHVTFGIMIYSSLLFIETVDVIMVVNRYMLSTALCRLILMFELTGMRKVDLEQQGMM